MRLLMAGAFLIALGMLVLIGFLRLLRELVAKDFFAEPSIHKEAADQGGSNVDI
ncbi:MAG TPA: hypothetical protein VGE92_02375 [Steroidobacteraceae bacterium]|jgi:hypothetical protein